MYACTSDEWVNDLNISICTMNHKLFLITFWIYINTQIIVINNWMQMYSAIEIKLIMTMLKENNSHHS